MKKPQEKKTQEKKTQEYSSQEELSKKQQDSARFYHTPIAVLFTAVLTYSFFSFMPALSPQPLLAPTTLRTAWPDRISEIDINSAINSVLGKLQTEEWATLVLSSTINGLDEMIATRSTKNCHYHLTDSRARVYAGEYYFQLATSTVRLKPGDEMIIPAGTPHAEGVSCLTGNCSAVIQVNWSPVPKNAAENTIFVDSAQCNPAKFVVPKQPSFGVCNSSNPPLLPQYWTATVLVHPFSPSAPSSDPMFEQLNIVEVLYTPTTFLLQVYSCETGAERLYWLTPSPPVTKVSDDGGATWRIVDMGWTFPSRNVLGNTYACVGTSPLNWMSPTNMEWWKSKVTGLDASTWFWFDAQTKYPFRAMFGNPPPTPTRGSPTQFAFFQMFSFSYFTNFKPGTDVAAEIFLSKRTQPSIPGFQCAFNGSLFDWNTNFGVSTFMVPVDYYSNPLPTTVYYTWGDEKLGSLSYRLQSTDMWYDYNPDNELLRDTALLFGGWKTPSIKPQGWDVQQYRNGSIRCNPFIVDGVPLGQQPPWWPKLGLGKVKGVISPNGEYSPLTGSNQTVRVIGVLFPPHEPQYPDDTYLWTWYANLDANPSHARPVTFMQSASSIGVGTSLALADYFDYAEYPTSVNTTIPWMQVYLHCLNEQQQGFASTPSSKKVF